ncbi:hypothetical protein [Francisella frigiditurris]|uniref:Uncharacterized protein n=1 Tax=Francisella frigiditurris TaxID=1542390 RepID=A0A1J0KTF2_9GAMM|nr:hypothetical protein [Francisella frigiditurris]APC97056.1 hypothetical protein KX01_518 [Francisella frigiditurris]
MGIAKILGKQLSLSTGILQKNIEGLNIDFNSLSDSEKDDLAMMAYNMHMQVINGLSEENLNLLSKLIANQIKKADIDISKDKYNKFSRIVSALDKEEVIVIYDVIEVYKDLCANFDSYYNVKDKQEGFNILVIDHSLTLVREKQSLEEASLQYELIQGLTRTALFKTYGFGFAASGVKHYHGLMITELFKEFIKYIDETSICDDKFKLD